MSKFYQASGRSSVL